VTAAPLLLPDDDYTRVSRAIGYISRHWQEQPDVAEMASAVGLTPAELTTLFRRWAGLSPKAFLQAVTLNHARRLLDGAASVLETAYETGLSGPGRLHDLFVTHEAMTPGEYKSGGRGLTIHYGFHSCPFGEALVMATERGLCGLAFADQAAAPDAGFDPAAPAAAKSFSGLVGRQAALADMTHRWPKARIVEDDAFTAPFAQRIFRPELWQADRPLRVFMIGTDFEVRVWETLLKIPLGRATTYSTIAGHIGKPKAARAVGAAVGRNPISFVVPCHRVLGKSGALTGYHWGITRKQAMLGWEAGRAG